MNGGSVADCQPPRPKQHDLSDAVNNAQLLCYNVRIMSRIPQQIIDQVLAKITISDLIGEYTRVERKGKSDQYMGLCPFHRENTPSFSISNDKGVYYCFGCQARGNAITFLKDHNGLNFPEAMEFLAARAGVELPKEDIDPAESRQRKRAEDAYIEVMRVAIDFYEDQLWGDKGQPARDYIEARGIDEKTARDFRLGYAPGGWSNLLDMAASKQMSGTLIERAGLAIERDGKGHYDRFRDRVMFPVLDISGRCLAFSGRTLEKDNPAKYINSPETRFYTKGRHLFGLHAARREIRAEDAIVLVEGNFDVVSLHARGIKHVIAPLGTALTDDQCHLIRRFTNRIILAFDGDRAGRAASEKALYTLLQQGLTDIATVSFDDGVDPDDFIQEHGADVLKKRIHGARSMVEEMLNNAVAPAVGTHDPSIKRTALLGAGRLLASMADDILANATAREVARRLEVDMNLVRKATASAGQEDHGSRRVGVEREDPRPKDPQQAKPSKPLNTLEMGLLECLHKSADRLETIANYHLFPLLEHRTLALSLEDAATELSSRGEVDIAAHLEASDDQNLIQAWFKPVTDARGFSLHTEDDAFESIIKELLIVGLRRKVREVDRSIAAQHRERDTDGVVRLLQRKAELVQSIDQLRGEVDNSV